MKTLFFLVIFPLFALDQAYSQDNSDVKKTTPFAKIELTSNLIEDGYTQTNNSFGLLTDVGYRWEQFDIGIRGSNVYFKNEQAHLTLQPHLSIIANFSKDSRFFVEHEERLYFNQSSRNGSKSFVGLEMGDYLFKYESLTNWWGLEITKTRFSFTYPYFWVQDYSSDFQIGYNIVGGANTAPYTDVAANLKFKRDALEYYAELIWLSSVVEFIPDGNPINIRLGVRAQF
jgi:hypothetical protein